MATFSYVARDQAGQRVEGKVAAATAQAVLAQLHARQLAPVTVQELRESPRAMRRISARHLAMAYRQLADLLRAGVPLLRALQLLGRSKAYPRLAKVLAEVAGAVAEGSRLADAMAAHGDVFPPIQIAMVRAGERGGFLEPVLQRMGAFLEQQADMRGKVIGNLIYPVALLLIGVVIVIVAMVFFVPKFRGFYGRIELPLPTKILLTGSDLLANYWIVMIAATVILAIVLWRFLRSEAMKRQLALAQLRAPALGPLVRNLAVGRFTRILGTLLENGIPMLSAMQISRDAAGHVLLAQAIDSATDAVRNGDTLAKPLGESGLFSDDIVEMISVGESANNLPQVLIAIADTIEKRIDRMLNVLVRLMEPLLLMSLAGVVLFIFVALIVPMMRMSASISH